MSQLDYISMLIYKGMGEDKKRHMRDFWLHGLIVYDSSEVQKKMEDRLL